MKFNKKGKAQGLRSELLLQRKQPTYKCLEITEGTNHLMWLQTASLVPLS